MEPLNVLLKRKHYEQISPGPVGSVGDVLTQVRLKHSAPDLPIRWEYYGDTLPTLGSSVADGQNLAYNGEAGPATLMDFNWNVKRQKKINHGWIFEDLKPEDMMVMPFDKSTPDYSWNNKIATVNHAFDSGRKFAPLPHGYSGQGLPRGGSVPRVTAVDMPEQVFPTQSAAFTGSIFQSDNETIGITLGDQTIVDPYHFHDAALRRRNETQSFVRVR